MSHSISCLVPQGWQCLLTRPRPCWETRLLQLRPKMLRGPSPWLLTGVRSTKSHRPPVRRRLAAVATNKRYPCRHPKAPEGPLMLPLLMQCFWQDCLVEGRKTISLLLLPGSAAKTDVYTQQRWTRAAALKPNSRRDQGCSSRRGLYPRCLRRRDRLPVDGWCPIRSKKATAPVPAAYRQV